MPIRKEVKHLYPPPKEWKRIRSAILERAADRCECAGECGDAHYGKTCRIPNRWIVIRTHLSDSKVVSWHRHDGCSLCLGGDNECRSVRCVLTIAHLDHDPTNSEPSNLRAYCQRCHLRYDRHEHKQNAAATRQRKRDHESGQVPLLGAEHLGFQKGNG